MTGVSQRLQAVLELTKNSSTLADIGTDHAYLPILACKNGFCKKAIACDINKGPLEIAAANIKEAGLSNYIETRLGNGLAPLNENEADCVVISGMGGMRIWNILQNEPQKAKFAKKIILQPQHDLEELRKNLHNAGYNITDEKLVREDSRFYVVLVASYTNEEIAHWTAREYFLGKYLCESPDFWEYLHYNKSKIGRYIQSVSGYDTRQLAETRLKWIDEYSSNITL